MRLQNKVTEYRAKCNKEIQELAIKCAEDTKKLEHNYHKKQEDLGIEIAKQEARLETVKKDEETYNRLLEEKNDEIERLSEIINNLIEN